MLTLIECILYNSYFVNELNNILSNSVCIVMYKIIIIYMYNIIKSFNMYVLDVKVCKRSGKIY